MPLSSLLIESLEILQKILDPQVYQASRSCLFIKFFGIELYATVYKNCAP